MSQQLSENLLTLLVKSSLGIKTDENLDERFSELIDNYMNDPNSSSLRELITLKIAGYEPLPGKLGRDGIDLKTNREKEVKPKNFTGKRTNGSGCFNDYTRLRFEKDKEYGLEIVHSLFVNGKIGYIVEFNFSAISDILNDQIIEKCEKEKNRYVRTASWSYKNWIDHPSLKIHHLNLNLLKSGKYVNKKLLNKLETLLNS